MQSITNDTFGPLIAYLVPGATALVGLSPFLPVVEGWLASSPQNPPTISGLLYLSLASLASGMTVSALRWATIDWFHARTGLPAPSLNFSRLMGRVEEYRLLIEIHYRHYQFYANMFVAVIIAYVSYRATVGWHSFGLPDVATVVLEPIFFFTSRDTLRKYYARTVQLFTPRALGRP
jgi:hypothetical protein